MSRKDLNPQPTDNHFLFASRENSGGKQVRPDARTLRALEELECIETWAEFREICQEQKRRRGW